MEWTDDFTLLEITKSDHVGLGLRTADCSSGDERRLQNGSSTSSFADLIFSLGTTEAGELGDVNPVNGGGGRYARDAPTFAKAADAGALSTLAYFTLVGNEMQPPAREAHGWTIGRRAQSDGDMLDAHCDQRRELES